MANQHSQFTKYEVARIIGARALQIAMDAPLLVKISDSDLKAMKYDALQIAEKEFQADALPITIQRPTPQKRKEKLSVAREEHVSDEEIEQKEKEVEKEVVQDAQQLGFAAEDDSDGIEMDSSSEEQ